MAVVLDDSDTNQPNLWILNKVALDVSIKGGVVMVTADIFRIL